MSITCAIFKLVKRLPTGFAILFCQFIMLAYLASQKQYRREIFVNYQKTFGFWPPQGFWFLLRLAFRLGKNFGVMVTYHNSKKILDKTQIYGENILYKLIGKYQKLIVVSFHYGLWELLPQIFQTLGYETYIATNEQTDKNLAAELFFYRSQNGVKLVNTIAEMKQVLLSNARSPKGRLLGFVLDNTSKTKRLRLSEPFPNFFILATPFVLAKLAKVPILSMFCYQKNNKICVSIDEVKSPDRVARQLRYYVEKSPAEWIFWGKQ